jgi:hypothetical protein
MMPIPNFIGNKLASNREYSGLEMPQDNVILFDKTTINLKEYLEPLNVKLKPDSTMH